MPLSDTALALVRRGIVTDAAANEGEQRMKLYGGGLDTALLELGASDEDRLTRGLAELLGVPLATHEILRAPPQRGARAWMDATTARRLGTVPRHKEADVLHVLVRPEHDHEGMVAWAAQHALLVEPALVSEVRFRAHLAAIYDVPLPPRYLALLAKLIGPSAARVFVGDRRSELRTPTPVATGADPIETLLMTARLSEPAARQAALRRLSARLHDPRVVAFRHALEEKASGGDPTAACGALRALVELRDKNAVPAIAELLDAADPQVTEAAHAALVQLTCDDFGMKSKRWLEFWNRMGRLPRVEWLLAALAHRTPELRLQASSELYELSGEYFGYHYDLPERDREEARLRWMAWWQGKKKSD